MICPPDLLAALPPAIALPADALLQGNAIGLGYVAQRFRREELLAARMADAQAECPQ